MRSLESRASGGPWRPLLLLAVFLSGAAGLCYQLAWTRRLVSVTSATTGAQAIVLAVFMAGLGIGALVAGRLGPRSERPLVAYALVEITAGLFAVGSIPLIDHSEHLRTLVAQSGFSLELGLWAQLFALVIFLLIPTSLMGASLPYLIEDAERRLALQGPLGRTRITAQLYGVNTLGAVLGCLLAGYVTIEHMGLSRTTWLGALAAGLAALIALGLVLRSSKPTSEEKATGEIAAPDGPAASLEPAYIVAASLAGLVGLGAEVIWTRLFSLVVFNTVYLFAQVLAVILLGIAAGASLSGAIVRRAEREASIASSALYLLSLMQLAAGLWIAAAPAIVVTMAGRDGAAQSLSHELSVAGLLLLFGVIGIPAALNAATLPLLAGISRVGKGSRAFGSFYLGNTIGSVVGSAGLGLVLIPALGARLSNALLACSSLGLAVLLAWIGKAAPRVASLGALSLLAVLGLTAAVDVPEDFYARMLPPTARVVDFREGRTSDVMVAEHEDGRRRLWINSTYVATTASRASRLGSPHAILGHLPALFVDVPSNALGIALGTGTTFASVLSHGFPRLHCVEINQAVIDVSRAWFAEANRGVLDDPRVSVHHDDGRAFLRSTTETFDLVVLEPLQAWSRGTSNLYTKEFYAEAKRVLRPGGVVAQWIPFYGQGVYETKAMVRSGTEVFDQVSLWLDRAEGIMLLHDGVFQLDLDRLRAVFEQRHLAPEFARNSVATPPTVLQLFLLGPRGIARWTAGVEAITDDRPFLEFAAARTTGADTHREILRSVLDFLEDPSIYAAVTSTGAAQALAIAKKNRDAVLKMSALPRFEYEQRASEIESALEVEPGYELLRARYGDLLLEWAEQLQRAGRPETEIEAVYLRGLSRDTGQGELAINLALLYLDTGKTAAALDTLEKAALIPRVREESERIRRRVIPQR